MAVDYSKFPTTDKAMKEHEMQTSFRVENLGDMTYTQFLILLREGDIERVVFNPGMRTMDVTTKESAVGRGRGTERVGLIWDPELIPSLSACGVAIDLPESDVFESVRHGLIKLFGPIAVTTLVILWSLTLGRKPSEDSLFREAQMTLVRAHEVPVTFDDVAGIDPIRAEIQRIVHFLQHTDEYFAQGASTPGGILLCGPPGTGKTLLARAMAGEAGVPFYSSSGSEFSNMFSGGGAMRVSDMFEKARRSAPCILFIDEFDGVAQALPPDAPGDDDSRETLDQLLFELGPWSDNKGVVVLAATNRPAALDEKLRRPPRFERILTIPYPDLWGRLDILRVHARGKPMEEDINFVRIARGAMGCSGAELMNLVNVAAIEAVRNERERVCEDDFFAALEQIEAEKYGATQATSTEAEVSPLMRRAIATYVVAKAVIGIITPGYDDVQKIVVTPDDLLSGYVHFLPVEPILAGDRSTTRRLQAELTVTVAGRVAEAAVLGAANVTPAGAVDLEAANRIAQTMIYEYGASEALGPVGYAEHSSDTLRNTNSSSLMDMSPSMAAQGVAGTQRMVTAAEAKAHFGLVTNWHLFQALVEAVLRSDDFTLKQVDVARLVDAHPPRQFLNSRISGFGFDGDSRLVWPSAYDELVPGRSPPTSQPSAVPFVLPSSLMRPDSASHPLNPYPLEALHGGGPPITFGPSSRYFKSKAWPHSEPPPCEQTVDTAPDADKGAMAAGEAEHASM